LDFEKTVVEFGCILNDTEVTRYVNITNNSPTEVKYRWSFLVGDEPCTVINRPKLPVTLPEISEERAFFPEIIVQEASTLELNKDMEEEEKGEFESTKVIVRYLYRNLY